MGILNEVHVHKKIPGTTEARVVKTNPYLRLSWKGGVTVYIRHGRVTSEDNVELDLKQLGEEFWSQLAVTTDEALEEVRFPWRSLHQYRAAHESNPGETSSNDSESEPEKKPAKKKAKKLTVEEEAPDLSDSTKREVIEFIQEHKLEVSTRKKPLPQLREEALKAYADKYR